MKFFYVPYNAITPHSPFSPNQIAHLQSAQCISYKPHLWECFAGHQGFLCTVFAGAEVITRHG